MRLTKKGSIDVLIISVAIALLLFVPLFRFFIQVLSTLKTIEQTKEVLEISSMSTFTELNRDLLGSGMLEIEESEAKDVFNRLMTELIMENETLQSIRDIGIVFSCGGGIIRMDSEATVLSSFGQPVHVEHSLEFVIDPVMEVS